MSTMRAALSHSIAPARRLACSIRDYRHHHQQQRPRWTQSTRHCPSALTQRTRRFHSDGRPPAKNPFEIQFHPEDEATIFKTGETATTVRHPRDEVLHDEIQHLHAELAGIFGEELEEYDGSGSSMDDISASLGTLRSNQSSASPFPPKGEHSQSSVLPSNPRTTDYRPTLHQQAIIVQSERLKRDTRDHTPTPVRSHESNAFFSGDATAPSVLVVHGPCSFVGSNAIGTTKSKQALLREMHDTAAHLGITISCRESNHEGEILDLLLNADPATSILLSLNGPLSETPLIRRALSHVSDNQVVLVSPAGIEHGRVPPSVRGVLTGFASARFEIALQAAAALGSARRE